MSCGLGRRQEAEARSGGEERRQIYRKKEGRKKFEAKDKELWAMGIYTEIRELRVAMGDPERGMCSDNYPPFLARGPPS